MSKRKAANPFERIDQTKKGAVKMKRNERERHAGAALNRTPKTSGATEPSLCTIPNPAGQESDAISLENTP